MNIPLIEKALRGKVVIPEFDVFKEQIDSIYKECLPNTEGEVCHNRDPSINTFKSRGNAILVTHSLYPLILTSLDSFLHPRASSC